MAYTKEEFEQMLILMEDDYVSVRSKYELYCTLTEFSESHPELMNDISPGFFTIIFDTLISDIFINISKLLDYKEGSVGTVYTLILDSYNLRNFFGRNKHKISEHKKSNHQKELNRQYRIHVLKRIRNKRFAHNDKKYHLNREGIIEDEFLSFNDLQRVFNVLHRIINYYYSAFFGKDIRPIPKDATDVSNLMEALAYYKQASTIEANINLIGAGLMPSKTGIISMDDI
ncbi:hypothetical protein OM416_20460 [Paenibacillus sp. LS1]|uniref:AbiU2 domain-containing protein n=1 Tax=Paenibacillus sp. LS1 TaxID=2992120 RepID=UPI00222E291D|nr:hypothetical protein [Paenibacillus sp. LS1]MCW3793971.1 hypothetical protein [Paenibacillus sp. LS1]